MYIHLTKKPNLMHINQFQSSYAPLDITEYLLTGNMCTLPLIEHLLSE